MTRAGGEDEARSGRDRSCANGAGGWYDADDLRWAVRRWAARMGVSLRQIHIRTMSTKWASISTGGRLTLDAGLLEVPKDLGELVIVHELVHLLAPNHGPVFRSFMLAYLPDWEERQQRLDSRGRGK
ncbi:MAG TPA: M48 family metallopeptidase [Armatimonadota bacterium]|nr:M48 family metallopeptidase [Armatimonadota bacterium]